MIAAVYLNRLQDGDAAAGRSHGAVRARQARRARAATRISRSTRRTTRTSTPGCRRARSPRRAGRRSSRRCIRRTCRTCTSSRIPDGHHEFTTNFAAHSVAVRSARREWDSVAALRRDTVRPSGARDAGRPSLTAVTGAGAGRGVRRGERAVDRHHGFASRRAARAGAASGGGGVRRRDDDPAAIEGGERAFARRDRAHASRRWCPTCRSW